MALFETAIFYFWIGAAVAVAVFVTEKSENGTRSFRVLTAFFFWPLHLPQLLSAARRPAENESTEIIAEGEGEITPAIQQVEHELEAALTTLDGWAEDVLAREKPRIAELRAAWSSQAQRIREMDRLLAPLNGHGHEAPDTPEGGTKRIARSEEARRLNVQKLRDVRRRAHDDLMESLAWVRELVSMIHLAKFTGAPSARAGELVAQIAAAVEGLSEVHEWRAVE